MQRLIAGLLVLVVVLMAVLVTQALSISRRLDVQEQARTDMLEARIIVLEKYIERIKARRELEDAGRSLQNTVGRRGALSTGESVGERQEPQEIP